MGCGHGRGMDEPTTEITIYAARDWAQVATDLRDLKRWDVDPARPPSGTSPCHVEIEGIYDDEAGAWLETAGALVEAVTGWDDGPFGAVRDVDLTYLHLPSDAGPGTDSVETVVQVRDGVPLLPAATLARVLAGPGDAASALDEFRGHLDRATARDARDAITAAGGRPFPYDEKR